MTVPRIHFVFSGTCNFHVVGRYAENKNKPEMQHEQDISPIKYGLWIMGYDRVDCTHWMPITWTSGHTM